MSSLEQSGRLLVLATHGCPGGPGRAARHRARAGAGRPAPGRAHDPALRASAGPVHAGPVHPGPPAPAAVPRELPPTVPTFTGRVDECAAVVAALTMPGPGRGRPAVVSLSGRGGVGKSTLAVVAAHRVAAHFVDGQVYVDLFGSTPGLRPRSAHEVLDRALRALGVPAAEVRVTRTDAAARFRTETASRRVLLVLDNATDTVQVAPVLPGGETSAVVVTSRQMLATLDTDLHLRLSELPAAHATAFLGKLSARLPADGVHTRRVVELCEGLPLALRIAGARLASGADISARDLANRLADERLRMDRLALDGLAVRSSLAIGYEALAGGRDPVDRTAARAFLLLGRLRVAGIEPPLVAAMLAEPDRAPAAAALHRLAAQEPAQAAP